MAAGFVAVLVVCTGAGPSASAGRAVPAAVRVGAPLPVVAGRSFTEPLSAGAVRPGEIELAFAGDVHFEGVAARALDGDLGSAASVLARADVAVVNLETAVTDRGSPQPKTFVFRAPARAMKALRTAGIDVVTVANNHGVDYGPVGLQDTLAAGRRYGMPVIGAGQDVRHAFAPYRTTVRGIRVAVIAATDVLDTSTGPAWTARSSSAGLASAKDPARLVESVRAAARDSDIVAVYVHWGVERVVCPTARQRRLADELVIAGADVVVGSHAHVVGPATTLRGAAIHYGLGNFVWYAAGGASAQSGVDTLRVNREGVVSSRWYPATIRNGRPELVTGPAARIMQQRHAALAATCALPSRRP